MGKTQCLPSKGLKSSEGWGVGRVPKKPLKNTIELYNSSNEGIFKVQSETGDQV